MQHCSGTYKVFNPISKKWEGGLGYTEARREKEYLTRPANVMLLSSRSNTRKPSTDARYSGNAERRAA